MHSLRYIAFITLLTLIFSHHPVAAQISDEQLMTWLDRLSVKKDPQFKSYRAVLKEVEATDSLYYCDAMRRLIQLTTDRNVYCQIRVSYIFTLGYNTEANPCKNQKYEIPWGDALDLAYEINDPFLIAMGHRIMTSRYRIENQFGLAAMHLMLAIEIQDSLGSEHFFDRAFDRYMLGEVLYHSRDYEGAVRSFEEALNYHAASDSDTFDTLNPYTLMFLYNTLGLAYDKLDQNQQAFAAFDKALQIAPHTPYKRFWIPLIKGNRGDIFFEMGQYDSAYVLLEEDVRCSLAGGKTWAHNAAGSLQSLARIKAKRGQLMDALADLYEANALLKQHYNSKAQSQIYYAFIEVFEKLHQPDSVQYYLDRYLVVHDSIEHRAMDARAEIVRVRMDNQIRIDQIKTLQKEKKRIAVIRNYIIAVTTLSFVTAFLLYKRERLKLQMRHQKAQEAARRAEEEVQSARDQLKSFTQHLLEKNTLIETLQSQLSSREISEDQAHLISALSHHAILTDQDWDEFKSLFEKVHPAFFYQIRNIAPDITNAELRIAALTKLRISSKEAANLLGISPASVNKTRQRLRQRLELENSADLEEFFNPTDM